MIRANILRLARTKRIFQPPTLEVGALWNTKCLFATANQSKTSSTHYTSHSTATTQLLVIKSRNPDTIMIWAACTTCFFSFFRVGEITVQSEKSFNTSHHLLWSDISSDDHREPCILKVILKRSKTNQLGKGTDIFIEKVAASICPISTTVTYMAIRESNDGVFFNFRMASHL